MPQDIFTQENFCLVLIIFFVSGAYIVQKYTFTCLDYLKNAQNGVTETTQRVVNDISDFTFVNYYFFVKYLNQFRHLSLPEISSVNVSLLSLPDFGWNIPW